MKNIFRLTAVYSLVLFICSSVRHILFQSTAWDLAIFDQAVYLISLGQAPLSSFTGFHMLGDHGALMLYPLALLYKVFPSVYWLLAVQALSLGLGGTMVWLLAKQRGLPDRSALLAMAIYCLYPLVFNINLFDFHPEVMAVPAFLGAIWAVRNDRLGLFVGAIGVVLSCKAVLALTVGGMGLWLLIEKRTKYAAIALGLGVLWFIVATQWLMPAFAGEQALTRFIGRYSDLGSSYGEIVQNFFLRPQLVLSRLFSIGTLEYMALLWGPIVYVFWLNLGGKDWTPLFATLPALMMNLLANDSSQRDLIHQYSLPILPFLLIIVIEALLSIPRGLITYRSVFVWALLGFILLSRLHFFAGHYWQTIDTWHSTKLALERIKDKGAVLTTAEIAPHLSQRPTVNLAISHPYPQNLDDYRYILLNRTHPGWLSSGDLVDQLLAEIARIPALRLVFYQNGIYLFSYE